MLTILGARENVDKDRYLYEQCAEDALLLVPDQYTLEAEKDLIRTRGRKGLLGMEVLSFSRLGSRILKYDQRAEPPEKCTYCRRRMSGNKDYD